MDSKGKTRWVRAQADSAQEDPTLSIIVATYGRAVILRLIESIKSQEMIPGDEVLIVCDGIQPDVERLVKDLGFPFGFIRTPKGDDWGNPQRNAAIQRAAADYLTFNDTDDIYAPGAFRTIRDALKENPGRPHMFRYRGNYHPLVWFNKRIKRGEIGDHGFVVPNIWGKVGRYGKGYAGDYFFLESTAKLWPPNSIVWREEVIQICRPHLPDVSLSLKLQWPQMRGKALSELLLPDTSGKDQESTNSS